MFKLLKLEFFKRDKWPKLTGISTYTTWKIILMYLTNNIEK